MMVPTLLAITIDRILEPAVRVSDMVAAMLISNSSKNPGNTFPVYERFFQSSGCKRCAGILPPKTLSFFASSNALMNLEAAGAQKSPQIRRCMRLRQGACDRAPTPIN
jgi:hypothetical protein